MHGISMPGEWASFYSRWSKTTIWSYRFGSHEGWDGTDEGKRVAADAHENEEADGQVILLSFLNFLSFLMFLGGLHWQLGGRLHLNDHIGLYKE